MLLHLLLLHLLLLLDDQRRVLGRRDNLTDLGFQLRRPPFQLIGIAVPRALSPESNDGLANPSRLAGWPRSRCFISCGCHRPIAARLAVAGADKTYRLVRNSIAPAQRGAEMISTA
jgi:hypothetical protein